MGTGETPCLRIEGQLTLFDPAQKKLHTWASRNWPRSPVARTALSDVTDVYFEETRPSPHSRKTERQPSPEGWRFCMGLPPETVHKNQTSEQTCLDSQTVFFFVALFSQFLFNVITYSHSFSFYKRRTKKSQHGTVIAIKKNKVAQPGNILKPCISQRRHYI